jgi:glycosyltransferase involved in cell wall biosynthesis
VPIVIRFHGSDAFFCKIENRHQKLKNYLFERLSVVRSNGLIGPTNFANQLSLDIFKPKNIPNKIIHYGIDLKRFVNENPNNYENGLILYIGTIIRKKGVLDISFIFNYVQEKKPFSKLLMIGPDAPDLLTGSASTYKLFYSNLSDSSKKNVEYMGKIDYESVISYIRKANVCIFPSYAETLGMVTIESMAMKKVVINSDFGWSRELIDDGVSGFLVNPKSHIEFGDKIISVFDNELLVQKIGEKAREKVENCFDISKIVHSNISFYTSLLK